GVLQFCALTGLWETWAVLWTVEPLALGLAFLVISAVRRSAGFFMAGVILCGIAGFGLIGMTAIMPTYWLLNLLGPALFISVGFMLLIWGVVRRSPSHRPAME
ncbi:MAG: hypothetical protein JXA14_15745, partial [Anaerolineae bacterium]|nr:hypothetical protein [Anaerolineae bacterium]